MNSAIVTDSGSTRNPSCTLSPPTGNQSNSTCWNWRSFALLSSRPMNTATVAANAPPHMRVANHPASGSPSLLPASTRTRKPASGSPGINQTSSSTSALSPQRRDVVGGGARMLSHQSDDDPEPDDHLGGGHHEYEEHDHLAADVVERAGEGDEGEIDGVEHELDAHEHHERIAPDEKADGADREQHGAEHQVPRLGDP